MDLTKVWGKIHSMLDEGISTPSPIREVHLYDETERADGDKGRKNKDDESRHRT